MSEDFDKDDFLSGLFGDFTAETPVESSVADKIRAAASSAPLFSAGVNEGEPTPEEIEEDEDVLAAKAEAARAEYERDEALRIMEEERGNTEALEAAQRELRKQMQELQDEFNRVEREKAAINNRVFEKRRQVRSANADAEAKERAVGLARQAAAQKKRLGKTVEAYGRIAENFDWWNGITLTDSEGNEKVIKCLPHQWDAMKFLASGGRVILGDEMGLGKTLSAIGSLDLVGSKRALVVTPAEITSNFLREVKRWAGHRKVVNIKGMTKAERNNVLAMAGAFEPLVVIVNYEAWRKDLSLLSRLIDLGFDTVIADEAHSFKNTATDAFSGLQSIVLADNICPLCGSVMLAHGKNAQRKCNKDGFVAGTSLFGYAQFARLKDNERAQIQRSVKNLWMMTGTPILNSPQDLYPMLYLIDPILFPHKSYFLRDYCWQNKNTGQWGFLPGGLESLMKKLRGKYLARTKKDAGVILPPQEIIEHVVEFSDDSYLMQQDIIKQLTKHAAIVLAEDNKLSAMGVLALITRQRQANVWPGGIQVWEHPRDEFGMPDRTQEKVKVFDAGDIKESIKVDKAMDLIMEYGVVEGNSRIAVFSQFSGGINEMKARLDAAGISSVIYDGSTPASVKDAVKANFDKSVGEAPKWQVVLCNYKTGGTGLNLTAANHTIILDEEWNPGKRDQAYGRTDRMGQDQNTFVHVIRVNATIDTWLRKLIVQKEELIKGFDSATLDIQKELLTAIKTGDIAK